MNETICAIATSQGVGAIAIIRVSGDNAINIVNKIFKGKDLTKVKSHTINYGHIMDKGLHGRCAFVNEEEGGGLRSIQGLKLSVSNYNNRKYLLSI